MNDVDDVHKAAGGPVRDAVYRAADGTVYRAVNGAVNRPAYGAVGGVMYGAVHGAAVGPVYEPLYHHVETIIYKITKAK